MLGYDYEMLTVDTLRERFPQYNMDDDTEFLYQADAGVLFASKAIKAAWDYAVSLGADTATGFSLASLTVADEDGVTRLTSKCGRKFDARAVVLAPGSWLSGLAQNLFVRHLNQRYAG